MQDFCGARKKIAGSLSPTQIIMRVCSGCVKLTWDRTGDHCDPATCPNADICRSGMASGDASPSLLHHDWNLPPPALGTYQCDIHRVLPSPGLCSQSNNKCHDSDLVRADIGRPGILNFRAAMFASVFPSHGLACATNGSFSSSDKEKPIRERR